jgi:hypothetical protein
MTEWMAIVFFCLNNGTCQFWASSESFVSETKCKTEVIMFSEVLKAQGADAAPVCIKIPKTKAADGST